MAQFKVTKPINFGNFTILDKQGCQVCHEPINNHAPKVGQIIEGEIVTRRVPDGNGGLPVRTGIIWPIMTNGEASTQGQRSIQFIDVDNLQPVQVPVIDNEVANPVPSDDTNEEVESHGPTNPETPFNTGDAVYWICENKWPVIIGLLILIGLVVIFSQD